MTKRPESQLEFSPGKRSRIHHAFRYPARFHAPAVRALVEQFTSRGDRILDPFCGSGTLLLEAAKLGRSSIGSDVDPVATFVARTKCHRYRIGHLAASVAQLLDRCASLERSAGEYEHRQHHDISFDDMTNVLASDGLWVPQIPNLHHWFRRYVIVDLARITREIDELKIPTTHRDFLRLCFASIIRNASNADPVPVSGLEVTSHMRRRDEAGRVVNPFALLRRACSKVLTAYAEWREEAEPDARARVITLDATTLSSHVRASVEAVITSPPYHNAVNYYRRHQLEMYWLRLTTTHEERLALLPSYIGRPRIPNRHPYVATQDTPAGLATEWEQRIRRLDPGRANDFKHYTVAMDRVFGELSRVLPPGAPTVFVVGRSTWNRIALPTDELMVDLAKPWFRLEQEMWYPVSNRYMSYSRRNDADIDRELVLVLRRCRDG